MTLHHAHISLHSSLDNSSLSTSGSMLCPFPLLWQATIYTPTMPPPCTPPRSILESSEHRGGQAGQLLGAFAPAAAWVSRQAAAMIAVLQPLQPLWPLPSSRLATVPLISLSSLWCTLTLLTSSLFLSILFCLSCLLLMADTSCPAFSWPKCQQPDLVSLPHPSSQAGCSPTVISLWNTMAGGFHWGHTAPVHATAHVLPPPFC